ncbi:TetR/AcrR family transcriptional regulator [Desulforhopalus sp. IMCC35007]|uniref:TetR/AcrR family transcriptional regulator n=1 Tax=Desulforhopalus sp. IMCC35007 TaxID=2569543 RepID=UPI0010ADF4F5|nr:TetR/AcrR family transcriptional regulator [Desulforhopalus sp. IMCC35007]TKB09110.1 TetR/AcrR family transcriptional regulator [Desulforhopalus sp. IMCC35007]
MLDNLNEDVKKRLEVAVMEVFSTSDFHKASIRDIADTAGVSFTTIYKHFGSKERLLFAFVNIWMERLTDRIEDHLKGIEDLKEKLRKVFWLHLDFYERHEELGRILFITLPMKTWMADDSFDQKRRVRLIIEVFKAGQKQGIINPHMRAGSLLDFLLGFIQRIFFMWIIRGKQEKLADEANALFEMVWQGIANPAIIEYKQPLVEE